MNTDHMARPLGRKRRSIRKHHQRREVMANVVTTPITPVFRSLAEMAEFYIAHAG